MPTHRFPTARVVKGSAETAQAHRVLVQFMLDIKKDIPEINIATNHKKFFTQRMKNPILPRGRAYAYRVCRKSHPLWYNQFGDCMLVYWKDNYASLPPHCSRERYEEIVEAIKQHKDIAEIAEAKPKTVREEIEELQSKAATDVYQLDDRQKDLAEFLITMIRKSKNK